MKFLYLFRVLSILFLEIGDLQQTTGIANKERPEIKKKEKQENKKIARKYV